MPTDQEQEAAERLETDLLSYAYNDATVIDRAVQAGVTPEHFSNPFHHHQWGFLCLLRMGGDATDAAATYQQAIQRGVLEKLGGIPYILQCSDLGRASQFGAEPAIAAIIAVHGKRQAKRLLEGALADLDSPHPDIERVRASMEQAAAVVSGGPAVRSRTLADIDAEINADLKAQEDGKAAEGEITWGLPKVDRYMKSIKRNEYCLVCARPSRGKTSMLTHLALVNLRRGKKVAYFNLEDADTQIVLKMAAQSAAVCVGEWASLMPGDRKRFMDAKAAMIKTGNLLVFDRDLTLEAIQSRCRLLAASFKPDLVIIDYLGLVRAEGKSFYERVSNASKAMIPLRKMLNCAVVVGQQLKRLESDDKEPSLSDLRDSGQLEEDAVRVVMLHWKESKFLDQEHRPYRILQPKYRGGPTTAVDGITFHAPTTRWLETANL